MTKQNVVSKIIRMLFEERTHKLDKKLLSKGRMKY